MSQATNRHYAHFEVWHAKIVLQLPNFNLENMILTYTKDLSWKSWPNSSLDFKEKHPNH
jgi:hypothetical protein